MAISIYPEQAMAGFGSELRGVAERWGSEIVRAENNRQSANGRAEITRGVNEFLAWMEQNKAEPGQYLPELERRKELIKQAALAKTTQPGAQAYIENVFAEQWPDVQRIAHRRSIEQIAKNATDDFEWRVKERTQNRAYTGEMDFLMNLQELLGDYDATWNEGNPLSDSLVSESQVNLRKQGNAITVATNYLLQHPGKDDTDVQNPNAFLDRLGIDVFRFSPEDAAQLKSRYRTLRNLENDMATIQNEEKRQTIELAARKELIAGNWEAAVQLINDNLEIMGPDWHTDALNKARNAASILAKQAINPYETTMNWTFYNKDRSLALEGKLDVKTIDEHVGPDGYSDKEATRLRGIVERRGGTVKDFEDSKSARFLKEMVEDWGRVRLGATPERIPVMREKSLRILQDAIDSAEKPLTDREKQETALRIFNGLISEAPTTTEVKELLTPEERARFEKEMINAQAIQQPAGTPAGDWGVYDGKGNVILNEIGIRGLLSQVRGATIEERVAAARKLAAKRGWLIPE